MRWSILTRKTHHWLAAAMALPVVVIIGAGLLLQVKKHWSWVQPVEQRGTRTDAPVDLDRILAAARSVQALGVTGWDDVERVDVRPSRGLAKLTLRSRWEVQVDLATGAVLQTAYRRSDLIESIHDGSFFAGEITRLGLFLPAGAVLLVLWGTGLWMVWLPIRLKRRRRRQGG